MTSIFLLSPANCAGQRTKMLLSERAEFALARQFRERGAPLGEVFAFLSGLYFRGKLTYARAFASPSDIYVITAGRGLLSPDTIITATDIGEFQSVPIDLAEPRYRAPLAQLAAKVAKQSPHSQAILLGSIATNKYTEVLQQAFGDRLLFPEAFIGRGDMSRGGLLLRATDEGRELNYIPVAGALRRGARPARLTPRPRISPPEGT